MPIVQHPFDFAIGPVNLTGFGLAMMAAFGMAHYVAQEVLAQRGDDPDVMNDVTFAALVGTIIGAKVYYAVLQGSVSALWSRGGFVFWGGFIGAVAVGPGALLSLRYLPAPISLLVGLLALLLILIAGLFGRVMIYAATGRWLQHVLVKRNKNSEAVALLIGTTFWIVLSSIPYVWPFVVTIVWVMSLGLALTARYRVGWKGQRENLTKSLH